MREDEHAVLLPRAYYSAPVAAFLAMTPETVLGALLANSEMAVEPPQAPSLGCFGGSRRDAWLPEIAILKTTLQGLEFRTDPGAHGPSFCFRNLAVNRPGSSRKPRRNLDSRRDCCAIHHPPNGGLHQERRVLSEHVVDLARAGGSVEQGDAHAR